MEGDFRIGDWLVQPLRDVIESAEQSIALEPKAMDLLVYLAKYQGEVLPKERLIRAIWADAFVTDEVLTNTIWKLRQAFGDDPKSPKIIQTIPRRGYQLIAEVVFEEAGDDTSGRYELQKQLGKGAMGEVHLATDRLLGRQVALKFLPEQMEEDEALRRKLFREARAAAALDQPFICKVYDTGQSEGRTFIALEYVEGQTLKEKLRDGPLEWEEALRVAGEIAEALQAAHDKSIVHRDIKPSNIMLTEQGHVKVMDFGVAKKLPTTEGDQEWTATLTADASSMGTLPYMSPEQVRGQAVDTRSDIFSFGVLLYEMLTGVHPFRRPLSVDTAAAILNEDPPALSNYKTGLPVGLELLMRRMLAKDREDRSQSIQEIRADLAASDSRRAAVFPARFKKLPKPGWGTLGLMSILFVAAVLIWRPWKTTQVDPVSRPRPLTSRLGSVGTPALSPDGNLVAFKWAGAEESGSDIYVQVIGQTVNAPQKRSTDPAAEGYPTFSHEGTHLAFLRGEAGTKCAVVVGPVIGSSETPVATVDFRQGNFYMGTLLSWSPKGNLIAIVDRDEGDEYESIFLLDIDSRKKRPLTHPPEGVFDSNPVFSPDGQRVAFIRDFGLVCIQEIEEKQPRCLPPPSEGLLILDLDWNRDASSIICVAGMSGDRYLWRLPVDGGEAERLSFGEGAKELSIARDANRLVYHLSQEDITIWRASGPDALRKIEPSRFSGSSTRIDRLPEYSPDGSRVAIDSRRSGVYQIYVWSDEESEPQQVTQLGQGILGLGGRWSPGGDRIVLDALLEGKEHYDVFVVDSNGGPLRNLTPDDFSDFGADWDPNGKWIYYLSVRDGSKKVFKVSSEGGIPELVSERGGNDDLLRVNDSGQILVWQDDNSIWSISPDTGEERRVLQGVTNRLEWCAWKDQIVYVRDGAEGVEIARFDPGQGDTEVLHALGPRVRTDKGITVSPDGQWLLFTRAENSRSDLMWVDNFR